jgi:hypothetical protein
LATDGPALIRDFRPVAPPKVASLLHFSPAPTDPGGTACPLIFDFQGRLMLNLISS